MNQLDIILKFLSYLNLDLDESKVYLSLLENGEQTILEISRTKKISRTNVYRIVDRLKNVGIVKEVTDTTGKKYIYPESVEKLEVLVREQESRVEYLRNIIPELKKIVPSSHSISHESTNVKLYENKKGMEQILWNILSAESECYAFLLKELEEVYDEQFLEKWKQHFRFKKLKLNELISSNALMRKLKFSRNAEYGIDVETKYIIKDLLDINSQMFIYDDKIAFFHFHESQLLGIEIQDSRYAELQKQLFNLAWTKAENI
jgi:sugar-specific transcriptional regulator TrmB